MNTIKAFKILMIIIVLLLVTKIAFSVTYTKNSWPTYSGYVISCDGNDIRLSCSDSGNGRNHWCNSYGTNGCQAFEGRNNYGSPGCLITCQIAKCSDNTVYGQCSATKPLFCDNGNLVNKASTCGCPSGQVVSGDSCITKCSDNTLSGQCSTTKPLFCDNGNLVNKASTCGCPSGQTVSGDNCVQKCSDNTTYGQCSTNKPLFCQNGSLINKANSCGCPNGKVVSGDDCITPPQNCSDGTIHGQCSSNKPLFCQNGSLVNKASTCGCPSGQSISGDNCVTTQLLSAVVGNKLVIIDIDAKVDGKKSSNLKDNEKINKKAKPESSVELKVTVKNDFNKSVNTKIEDIEVKATIESIDDGDDLEEESSSFDLKAQSDKTATFRFKLPLNVEEGDYTITIEAGGEDENGNEHSDDADIELEVEKEKHDLRLLLFEALPAQFNCTEFINVNVKILNIGQDDENNAVLELNNVDIELNERISGIKIASEINNIYTNTFKVRLPDFIDEGTYTIQANLRTSDSKMTDTKSSEISVGKCSRIKLIPKPLLIERGEEIGKIIGEEAILLISPKVTARGLIDITSSVFNRFFRMPNIWDILLWLAIILIILAIVIFLILAKRR